MKAKEQESIDKLYKLLSDIRTENQKFREDIKLQVDTINKKTEAKHLPVTLEQNILITAQEAVGSSIKTVLTNYDSPLNKLVKLIIDENSKELKELISDSFTKVIRTDEFKQSIISAFSHKVARTIISNNDGLFDRVSNEMKQDAMFKAKMVLAVSTVIEEVLKERKNKL